LEDVSREGLSSRLASDSFLFRSIPFPFHLVLHQTLGNEINSAFLRNWRASGGVEDIFLGPPENSLFRDICFSIKVGYRHRRDER